MDIYEEGNVIYGAFNTFQKEKKYIGDTKKCTLRELVEDWTWQNLEAIRRCPPRRIYMDIVLIMPSNKDVKQ